MSHTPSSWRRRLLRRAVVVPFVAVLATLAAAPAGAQTTPWQTYPAQQGVAAGASPTIVMVGDSLIVLQGVGAVAGHIENVTGRTTLVNAAISASWVTYAWPGEQNGNPFVWDLAGYTGARMTVGALAANDARVLTTHPSYYNQQAQYSIMSHGVTETRKHSRCVLLVNVKRRNGVADLSYASAQAVNDNMAQLAANFPGGRVYVADWDAHAQSSWFIPGDIHLTPAGAMYYSNFISTRIQHHITTNGC